MKFEVGNTVTLEDGAKYKVLETAIARGMTIFYCRSEDDTVEMYVGEQPKADGTYEYITAENPEAIKELKAVFNHNN